MNENIFVVFYLNLKQKKQGGIIQITLGNQKVIPRFAPLVGGLETMIDRIIMCSNKIIRIISRDTGKQVAVLEMDKKEWKTKVKPVINGFALNKKGTD